MESSLLKVQFSWEPSSGLAEVGAIAAPPWGSAAAETQSKENQALALLGSTKALLLPLVPNSPAMTQNVIEQ